MAAAAEIGARHEEMPLRIICGGANPPLAEYVAHLANLSSQRKPLFSVCSNVYVGAARCAYVVYRSCGVSGACVAREVCGDIV